MGMGMGMGMGKSKGMGKGQGMGKSQGRGIGIGIEIWMVVGVGVGVEDGCLHNIIIHEARTGVCENRIPFVLVIALQCSSRNCSPAPELVF